MGTQKLRIVIVGGGFAGANLTCNGRATAPFAHRSRGMMATVGHLKGVAQIFGLRLSGVAAWMLWRAYYLSQMSTLGRKVRIFVE
jgi:NADH:ubiquinone reductase (H+-translocating)